MPLPEAEATVVEKGLSWDEIEYVSVIISISISMSISICDVHLLCTRTHARRRTARLFVCARTHAHGQTLQWQAASA